jgi:uncharacterized protein YecE (DUF72 family)
MLLADLLRTVHAKIAKDAASSDSKTFYVYFDRPKKFPLPERAKTLFHVRENPGHVPDASPEKKGFTRYAAKVSYSDGVLKAVPWD